MQLARNDAVYARKSILHEPRDEYEQKAHIVEENPFSMVKFGAKSTAISSRQINLHSYHHEMSKKKAYAEVKIGGHPLDYKRIFYTGSMLHGHQPIKTGSSLQYASRTHRSSLAYQFRGKETLEYACVKIGGHPLDHVPFIDRGQPSRPLLGYQHPDTSSPKPQRLQPQLYRIPRGNLGPQLYDCSRCLRLRQNARLQLCCGHPICSTCVSSSTVGHVKRDSTSFIECVQCNDYIAIQAVVFPHRTMSLEFPIARSLSALEILEQHQLKSPIPSQTDWRIQAALATLSFTAGQIAPRILSQAFKENFWKNKSKTIKSAVKNHTSQKIEAVEKKEFSIQKGPERWQKRLQSLEETSKLFKYRFIRTLGIGNFAEVMLVRNHKGQLVVLKESDKLQEALNEISILSKIQSPHVVQIKNYFIEQVAHRHFAYIEMEFCEKGDLIQLLNLGQMDKFLFEQLLRHLCIGLKEIHQRGIIHRDLKPGNVLLSKENVAKIADFGVSTCLESDLMTHHAAGTLSYMAPEVRRYFLGENISYTTKADVWSLGALAVAMLTGNAEPRVTTRPLEDVLEELITKKISPKHLELVKKMLDPLPDNRPSLDELLHLLQPSLNAKL